jgi:hypothetical protein
MLHREEYLPLLDKAMSQTIQRLQAEGCIRFFGISVYTPQAALDALAHPAISIVQIPASLFDRRFENGEVLGKSRVSRHFTFYHFITHKSLTDAIFMAILLSFRIPCFHLPSGKKAGL